MARVTTMFLDVLGVQPIRGRGFLLADTSSSAGPALLIAYRVWRAARVDVIDALRPE
jgi:hypothetical protein